MTGVIVVINTIDVGSKSCKPLIIVFTLCRRFSIVAANNHYAGFGPGTVNTFRQLIGLEEVECGDENVANDNLEGEGKISTDNGVINTEQKSLSDFK